MTSKSNKNFHERVYGVVRLIPCGRVTSYGAIAKYIGSPQSSRMVGWAMNLAHNSSPYVPAHRVVNRIGLLTGKMHFGSTSVMEELLLAEGIIVKGNKIEDFQAHFWDPMLELQQM